jgi:phosphate:Na+ symporter
MYIVDEFEQIGDVLSVTLLNKAEIWCKGDTHFSEEGKKELLDFHAKTMKLLYQAYATFNESDKKGIVRDARKFKASYKHFRQEFFDLEKQHYNRLKMDVEDSVVSSRTHMEIIGSFKVIGSHATNIARIILKEEKNGGESPNRGELEGNSEGGI